MVKQESEKNVGEVKRVSEKSIPRKVRMVIGAHLNEHVSLGNRGYGQV